MQGNQMYEESIGETYFFKKIWCHREKSYFLDFKENMVKFQRRLTPDTPNSRNESKCSNLIRKYQVIKYYTSYQSEIHVLVLKRFFVRNSKPEIQNTPFREQYDFNKALSVLSKSPSCHYTSSWDSWLFFKILSCAQPKTGISYFTQNFRLHCPMFLKYHGDQPRTGFYFALWKSSKKFTMHFAKWIRSSNVSIFAPEMVGIYKYMYSMILSSIDRKIIPGFQK